MEYMFERCSSLYYIPDISVWNTPKIENINHMFSECSSLLKAPDISKWNQKNVNNKYDIFLQQRHLTTDEYKYLCVCLLH